MPRKPDEMQLSLSLDECPEPFLDIVIGFEVVTTAQRGVWLPLSDVKQLSDKDRRKVLDHYAIGFGKGMFGASGEPIIVSETGRLIKGVKVCSSADGEFVRLVIRNFPDRSFRKTGVKSQRNDMLSHPSFAPPIAPDPGVSLQEFADAINAGTDPRYPTVHRTYLTPEMAAPMVAATKRRMTPSIRKIIDGMVSDLRAGLWEPIADTICCTASLVILDGWMRAVAVVESGVRMPAILVRNVHPGFAPTFGSGLGTDLGDRLYANGYNQPWGIVASLRRFAWWVYRDADLEPSLGQFCEMLDDHGSITNSVSPTYHARKVMHLRLAIILHYCFHDENPERATAFFDAFRAAYAEILPGNGNRRAARRSHPVLRRLRDRLLASGPVKDNRLESDRRRIRYVIQAWNAFQAGRVDVRFKDGAGLPALRIPPA